MNALADQIVDRDVRDRAVPVTAAHVEAAKETILLERSTSTRSSPGSTSRACARSSTQGSPGETTAGDVLDDDFAYVLGLGLLRKPPPLCLAGRERPNEHDALAKNPAAAPDRPAVINCPTTCDVDLTFGTGRNTKGTHDRWGRQSAPRT